MKKIISLLLILIFIWNLTACSPNVSLSTDNERIFTDSCGRQVEIPKEIIKIVPSGSLAQIVLFAIAPEMFVGLASNWDDSASGIISDEYYTLPYLGQLYSSADLNIEVLAAAEPDLIIDLGSIKKSTSEELDNLQTQTNIPAVFVESTFQTMPETFRTLGSLLGKESKAEELAQFCERVYNRTISIMDKVGAKKPRALILGGTDGLNVLAKGTYHTEIMDLLTDNVAVVDNPSSKGFGNVVDMEQIMLWNPEFILFMPESIYDTVSDKVTWKELDAITSGNYVEVPNGPHNWMGMPPSAQCYLGMIWLTALLYPEYCDYDVKAEILEYYRLFYHCDLTDTQYDTLTKKAAISLR